MSEESYLGPMSFDSVYAPTLDKLESRNEAAVQQLRTALQQTDGQLPGFLLELTKALLAKTELNINLQEAYLRLQANAPADALRLRDPSPLYAELSERALSLRRVLSRVPDEMSDRRHFLETIKEIAQAIKKTLDATNAVHAACSPGAQPAVGRRKKEFVHYSKRFSNTLKDYFRGADAELVFVSANQLIFQTTLIIRTVRDTLVSPAR